MRQDLPVADAHGHLGLAAGAVELPVQRRFAHDRPSLEDRQEAGPVDRAVLRHGHSGDRAQRGQQVHAADRLAGDLPRPGVAGPAEDARHADAAFVHRALLVAQRAGRAVGVNPGDGRAVVAGEQNQGALAQSQLVDAPQQSPHAVVELGDVAVMGRAAGIVRRRIERGEARVGGDRLVRLVEAGVQEEGLALRRRRLAVLAQPPDGLAGHDLGGIPFELPDRLAVLHEVVGVVVVGQGVVLRGEPVVEAVVARLGLPGQFEAAVEVPLAHVAGGVAGPAQQRGHGDLLLAHVHGAERGDPVVDADAKRGAPGHQAGPGRRAVGRGGVAVGQAQPLARQLVDVGRLDHRVAIAGQVAVAEIVGQQDEEVGLLVPRFAPRLCHGRRAAEQRGRQQQGQRPSDGTLHETRDEKPVQQCRQSMMPLLCPTRVHTVRNRRG